MTKQQKSNDAAASDPAVAELAAAVDTPAEVDPRDAEIAALEAELERLRSPHEMDAKDRALAQLRADRDALTATPEGENAELRRAIAALQAQVERMAAGEGLVPVPEGNGLDPLLYGMVLSTGELIKVQHPHATHHYSPEYGITVPVTSYFTLAPEDRELASA